MRNSWETFGTMFKYIVLGTFAVGLAVAALLAISIVSHVSIDTGHHHGNEASAHEGTCPDSDIPDYYYKRGVTECVIGSPVTFRKATSTLDPGNRRDSQLWIWDKSRNNRPAIGVGHGCGRRWTVTDSTDTFPGLSNGHETNCNLTGHGTGVKNRFGNWVYDSQWARHPK